MNQAGVQLRLDACRSKLDDLERFLTAFASSISPPIIYDSGAQHWGFRFTQPGIPNFCLLKGVRALSGLNAIAVLCRNGYTQEIVVLLRTIVEFSSHIKFALIDSGLGDSEGARKYVAAYFEYYKRNEPSDFKRPKLKQESVHKAVGQALRQSMLNIDGAEEFRNIEADRLMSNVYLNYSNYVHARYPEVMDLYGGRPGHFHVRGMAGTPKDTENIEVFESAINSVSLCFKQVAIELKLNNLISADKELIRWFKEG